MLNPKLTHGRWRQNGEETDNSNLDSVWFSADCLEESRWFLHLQGSFWQSPSNSPQYPQPHSCKFSLWGSLSRYREFSRVRKLVRTKWDISVYLAWQKEIIFKHMLRVYSQQKRGVWCLRARISDPVAGLPLMRKHRLNAYSVLKNTHRKGNKIWQHKD